MKERTKETIKGTQKQKEEKRKEAEREGRREEERKVKTQHTYSIKKKESIANFINACCIFCHK